LTAKGSAAMSTLTYSGRREISSKKLGWVWAEDVEKYVNIGAFSFPTMDNRAQFQRKLSFNLLSGTFSTDGVNEFLSEFFHSKEHRYQSCTRASIPKVYGTFNSKSF